MVILYDTSVLIASLIREHPHFSPSKNMIVKLRKKENKGHVSFHSLAEVFASITAYPIYEEFVTPSQALGLIEHDILGFFEAVELSAQDYRSALQRVAEKDLTSGAIYDALIYQAAIKSGSSHLVTWNQKHFERLSSGEISIVTPEFFQ